MKVVACLSASVVLLAACATEPAPRAPADAAQVCAALTQPIDASLIGLPSRGAAIEAALLVAPADMKIGANTAAPAPPEFVVTPATPEYCRVTGTLAPV